MSNRNAKLIIPFVIVVWLAMIVVIQVDLPPAVEVGFFIAIAVTIPVMVFYLMAAEGWSTLARLFRAREPFTGRWRPCPSGQMALVSVDDPEFARRKLRLVGGTLRLATSDEGLHLSMLLGKIPILGRFFPDVLIPWAAVRSARAYEAPGWFRPASEPGALLQAGYDPNYTGTFIELVVGEPPVFIQLSADMLGEGLARLPLEPAR
jgi:hypothetical protein